MQIKACSIVNDDDNDDRPRGARVGWRRGQRVDKTVANSCAVF
jgi:hypothetical protein